MPFIYHHMKCPKKFKQLKFFQLLLKAIKFYFFNFHFIKKSFVILSKKKKKSKSFNKLLINIGRNKKEEKFEEKSTLSSKLCLFDFSFLEYTYSFLFKIHYGNHQFLRTVNISHEMQHVQY